MSCKNMVTIDKEELFDLMCKYGYVEDKICDFLIVLNALLLHYEDSSEHKEIHANLSVIEGYLKTLQKQFAETISMTDDLWLRCKA